MSAEHAPKIRARTPSRQIDFELWQAWCAATGRDHLRDHDADTLAAFTATCRSSPATSRRRLRSILSSLTELGARPLQDLTRQTVWRTSPDSLDLFATLAAVPTPDWPDGFLARRDAFIIVLTGAAGLTREQARRIRHPALSVSYGQASVDGRLLPFSLRPAGCPSCHTTRWLGAWSAYLDGGQAGARAHIDAFADHDVTQHVCRDHAELVSGAWEHWPHLLPPIDRRGLADTRATIGPRAISRVIAAYQTAVTAAGPPPAPVKAPQAPPAAPWRRVDPDPDGLLASTLDDLEHGIDAVMARISELNHAMGDTARLLRRTSSTS